MPPHHPPYKRGERPIGKLEIRLIPDFQGSTGPGKLFNDQLIPLPPLKELPGLDRLPTLVIINPPEPQDRPPHQDYH